MLWPHSTFNSTEDDDDDEKWEHSEERKKKNWEWQMVIINFYILFQFILVETFSSSFVCWLFKFGQIRSRFVENDGQQTERWTEFKQHDQPTDRPIIIIITLARMEGERIEKLYNDNDYSYGWDNDNNQIRKKNELMKKKWQLN